MTLAKIEANCIRRFDPRRAPRFLVEPMIGSNQNEHSARAAAKSAILMLVSADLNEACFPF